MPEMHELLTYPQVKSTKFDKSYLCRLSLQLACSILSNRLCMTSPSQCKQDIHESFSYVRVSSDTWQLENYRINACMQAVGTVTSKCCRCVVQLRISRLRISQEYECIYERHTMNIRHNA